MVSELERQSDGLPVEILALIDNKKRVIGAKRNNLIEQAQGEYVAFVDDDDRIETDYVQTLVETIIANRGTDCVTFDVEVSLGGLTKKITKFDPQYAYSEDENYYYRKPNHVMCYKSEISKSCRFLDIAHGEDDEWAARASIHIKEISKINRTLYYYDYTFKRPEDNHHLKNWENHILKNALLK